MKSGPIAIKQKTNIWMKQYTNVAFNFDLGHNLVQGHVFNQPYFRYWWTNYYKAKKWIHWLNAREQVWAIYDNYWG